jgi:hypothetical protein
MLRAARAPEHHGVLVRAISAGWLAAATGRVLSRRAVGPPDPLYRRLTVAEFVIPAVLVGWQRAVARAAQQPGAT